MRLKTILDEDFVNYKVPSMFLCTAVCSFKCDQDAGTTVCQNSALANQPSLNLEDDYLIRRYLRNPITKAIVFGGLEPIDQLSELYTFISKLRHDYHCDDTVVIYTGYRDWEIQHKLNLLRTFPNLIVKFGRFVPNQQKRFDEVLGVFLASPNQYAERIS